MKFPRWLVGVLVAASLIGAVLLPAWWWIIWPGRTASAFIAAVRDGDFVRANQFLETDRRFDEFDGQMMLNNVNPRYGLALRVELWREVARAENVRIHPRSIEQLLRGQQRFDLGMISVRFTAECDTIVTSFD